MRKLAWTPNAWADYLHWDADKRTHKKINALLKDIMRDPINGIGKPEPLKGDYSQCWSRRINEKDRLVYSFTDEEVTIFACRGHYE